MQVESDMIEVLMNITLLLENENLLLNYFTLLDTEETLGLAQVL